MTTPQRPWPGTKAWKETLLGIRCYAFDFLVERNVDSGENLLLSHIRDTQTVSVFSGCVINDVYVNV